VPHAILRKKITNMLPYLVLGLWAVPSIFAAAWVVLMSLKTNSEILVNIWGLPQNGFQWSNYIDAWKVAHMSTYFLNSLMVVSSSILLLLLVGAPAAYVLARFDFKSKVLIYFLFLAGLAVPRGLLVIPLFVQLRKMSLINSLGGLSVVYVAMQLSFTILFLTPFFSSLPRELEDAAAVDGASAIQTFFHIMLPLSAPGLIVISILNFIDLWNEFLLAFAFLLSPEKHTVAVGLYSLYTSMRFSQNWVGMFSGVVIVVTPILIVYLFFSRRITSGLTVGALKG